MTLHRPSDTEPELAQLEVMGLPKGINGRLIVLDPNSKTNLVFVNN